MEKQKGESGMDKENEVATRESAMEQRERGELLIFSGDNLGGDTVEAYEFHAEPAIEIMIDSLSSVLEELYELDDDTKRKVFSPATKIENVVCHAMTLRQIMKQIRRGYCRRKEDLLLSRTVPSKARKR